MLSLNRRFLLRHHKPTSAAPNLKGTLRWPMRRFRHSRCRPGSYCARRSRQRTRLASTAACENRPSRQPSFLVSDLASVVDEQPPVIVLDDVANGAAALDHDGSEPALVGVVVAGDGEPD